MEVTLDKRYPIAASPEQCWTILSDIRATAACMPGAQITEQIDDSHFKGTVKSKVGPAVMQFAGEIELRALDATARSLDMTGKGADKAGSSAAMNLVARLEAGDTPGSTVLVGVATVTVNGKLAQFGSRLIGPVSDAMLAQFADNFRAAAAAVPAPANAVAEAAAVAEAGTPAAADAPVAPVTPVPAPVAPAPASTELNALSLLWAVVKGWWAGLWGKRA